MKLHCSLSIEYDNETEQYFILNLIVAALSYGDLALNINNAFKSFIEIEALPTAYDRDEQIRVLVEVLSIKLLCMGFVQGLPVVGVVGALPM